MEASPESRLIEAAVERLFDGFAFASVWSGDGVPPLWPDEEASIARARDGRREEFARGRAAARAALVAAGGSPGAIGMGPNREPLWPSGYVGSITHCKSLVASVAGRTVNVSAIGVDAEPEQGLPLETKPLILLASEHHTDPVLETVVFSAKESIYKAIFPLTQTWMDFLDVEVTLHGGGRFTAVPAPDKTHVSAAVTQLQGRFDRVGGFVLTGCLLPRLDDATRESWGHA